MNSLFNVTTVYFRAENTAGSGAGSGSDGSAPPTSGAAPTPGMGGAPAAGADGSAAAAEKLFSYKEDRSTWVDPERYKKAEALSNRAASELERARGVIAEQNRRIAALAGVNPPNPADTEAQNIAEAFFAIPQFSHLRHVTPDFLRAVSALVQDGSSIAAARDHVWNAHTDRFLDRLDSAFAGEIGVDALSPGQQRKLRAAFGALIPDEETDPQGHAAFAKRYEANDDSLIEEFVKEYVEDMLVPARRQATIPTVRRAVPRSGPAAPVVTQKAKTDYSNMTVPQMLDAAEKEAEALGR